MYKIVIVFLLFFSVKVFSQNRDYFNSVLRPTDPSCIRSLNGMWNFRLVEGSDWSEFDNFYCSNFKADDWNLIEVPACWDALGYLSPKYATPDSLNGLYRTSFELPNEWDGKRIFLSFDGVLRGYELWVNEQYVGKWESSYNTCNFDITRFIKQKKNLLAVRVYTYFKGSDFDSNDDWGQVGINRGVSLFAVPQTYIKDLTIVTDQVTESKARVRMNFDIVPSVLSKSNNINIIGYIKEPGGSIVTSFNQSLLAGNQQIVEEFWLDNPLLWNAETPNLYTLEYKLVANDEEQNFVTRFGVREITIEKNVIKLNGKKVKFRGVNLHETEPFYGKVVSKELDLQDLSMMKAANINFVRCSHYPRAPHFYDICDSLGLYVINEIPFGFGDSFLYDTSYKDILFARADATVKRDKNHPSILFWSIGNENPLTPIAEETGRFVKQLDPTRLICYPMIHNYFLSLNFELPKFIDVFAPHYPYVPTLRYYAEMSNRPLLFTEYCHSLGQSLEQHKELWEIIEVNDNLAGGCVWEWVDQGIVKRGVKFPGLYTRNYDLWLSDSTCISMHGNSGADGVLYANRVPLSNYYELRRNYAQVVVSTSPQRCKKGENKLKIGIKNRFDFSDLFDKVFFKWNLANGKQIISSGIDKVACLSGDSTQLVLDLFLPEDPARNIYTLNIDVCTNDNYNIGNYTVPILSLNGNLVDSLYTLMDEYVPNTTTFNNDFFENNFQKYPLLRVGRKPSMSEELRAKEAIFPYLIEPLFGPQILDDRKKSQNLSYISDDFLADGQIMYRLLPHNGIMMEYKIRPKTYEKLLLEAGIGFLLNEKLCNFQWIGFGPYSSYPGKQSANNYGLHALKVGDLYFEGNRMDVDMLVCTDDKGNGFLLIAPDSNVNFEQTDIGVILSFNSYVSGLCGKMGKTAYPIFSNDKDLISNRLILYPLKAQKWPQFLSDIFYNEELMNLEVKNPFITAYDTYLLRYRDIIQ